MGQRRIRSRTDRSEFHFGNLRHDFDSTRRRELYSRRF
jgi:hypothetical protein